MSVDETTVMMTANASHTPSTPLEGVCFSMCSPECANLKAKPADKNDLPHSDWIVISGWGRLEGRTERGGERGGEKTSLHGTGIPRVAKHELLGWHGRAPRRTPMCLGKSLHELHILQQGCQVSHGLLRVDGTDLNNRMVGVHIG